MANFKKIKYYIDYMNSKMEIKKLNEEIKQLNEQAYYHCEEIKEIREKNMDLTEEIEKLKKVNRRWVAKLAELGRDDINLTDSEEDSDEDS